MGFLDDVQGFFGFGDKAPEGPITVPLGYDDATAASDPGVKTAEAAYSAACAREDAAKQAEAGAKAVAEGKRTEDWVQKSTQAQAEADQLKVQYEGARTKAQGGDLYEDQKQALAQRLAQAQFKARSLAEKSNFEAQNPIAKYMDAKVVEEVKAAGLARMQAQQALEAAKHKTAQAR